VMLAANTNPEPGIYSISHDDYEADPCPTPSLRASLAKIMWQQSPRHVWLQHPKLNPGYKPTTSKLLDKGLAIHDLLDKGGENVVVIDFDSWRTNASKEQRDEAHAAGKVPILAADFEEMRVMVDAVSRQLRQIEGFEGSYTSERTVLWREGEAWCRSRDDRLPDAGNIVYDYKSCDSAEPEAFTHTLFNLGYDIQAAFHERGLKAVGWHEQPELRFVAMERTPPYGVSVIALGEQARKEAHEKVEWCLSRWKWCLERDWWPGYSTQVAYVTPPVWVSQKLSERNLRESLVREALGKTEIELSINMHKPLEVA